MKQEPKTSAVRQAEYRKRCKTRAEGYTATLHTQLDFGVKCSLADLAHYYGITQRKLLEELIKERHTGVVNSLDDEQFALFQEKKLIVTK